MKIHQTSDRFDGRRRLIKANMPSPSNPQNLYIYAPISSYFLLILQTEISDLFSTDFSIGNIDIFPRDINMVEQVKIHIVVVRLTICFRDWEILIQVESDHVFETHLSAFIHSYQLTIYA